MADNTKRKGKRGGPPKHVQEEFDVESWNPKTSLGQKVKTGEISELSHILDNGHRILEHQIIDILIPNLQNELLLIGQAKGKFGGGQRRIFKQTQKKTKEGNKPKFSTCAVVGNGNGFVGVGFGKSKETVPAREKSFRKAKLNIFKIARGCGSWECGCGEPHSLPFAVEGVSGSSRIQILPAPKGTGLRIESQCAKVLQLAGIQDAWSVTRGQTKTKNNLLNACVQALHKLTKTKTRPSDRENLGIITGKIVVEDKE